MPLRQKKGDEFALWKLVLPVAELDLLRPFGIKRPHHNLLYAPRIRLKLSPHLALDAIRNNVLWHIRVLSPPKGGL